MSFGILDQLMRQQVSGQQGPDSVRRVPVNARSSGQQQNIDPRQIMALGGMTQSTAQRPQAPPVAAAPPPQESLFSKIGSGIQKFTSDPEKMARLAAGFNTMRLNPDPNIAKMAENQIERSQTNKDANQTVALLRQKGFHDLANMVEANPTMAKEALAALAKRELETGRFKTMTGAQLAKQGIAGLSPEGMYSLNTGTGEITPLAGQRGAETFGTTVRTYTEGDNVVPYVTSNYGNIKPVELPEGATEVDMGTTTGLMNDQGVIVGSIPKNVSETAAEKKFGALEIENIVDDERAAQRTVDVLGNQFDAINNVLNDPDKLAAVKSYVGPVQGRLPAISPTQTLGESITKNLSAKSFLRAFEQLKGGGQITEREGAAAQAAIDRLGARTLSDEDYVAAMIEARDELQILVDRAEAKKYAANQALLQMRDSSQQVIERIVP